MFKGLKYKLYEWWWKFSWKMIWKKIKEKFNSKITDKDYNETNKQTRNFGRNRPEYSDQSEVTDMADWQRDSRRRQSMINRKK